MEGNSPASGLLNIELHCAAVCDLKWIERTELSSTKGLSRKQFLTKDPRKESRDLSEHAFVGLLVHDLRRRWRFHNGIRKDNLAAGKRLIYRLRRRRTLLREYKGRFEISGFFFGLR